MIAAIFHRVLTGALASSIALGAVAIAPSQVATAAPPELSLHGPQRAPTDRSFAVRLSVPAGVAAVDGRVSFAADAAELVGVAPSGGGTALRPVTNTTGGAFAAYGLDAGSSALDLVIYPLRAGRLEIQVAIDTATDGAGTPIELATTTHRAIVQVGSAAGTLAAPPLPARARARAARAPGELEPNGRIDRLDLDAARLGWSEARGRSAGAAPECGASLGADPNRDGCTDIADVQATFASQGTQLETAAVAPAADRTFTVTSPLDTADASPGDGTCADSLGRCTLRAAIVESNRIVGNDTIQFDLPGTAPALIQLLSRLPIIGSRNGSVTIDGYTQAGSSENTAAVGSNAVPGVEIRGPGTGSSSTAFFITSAGNTLRGLMIHNVDRAIFIDGPDAHDNRIAGNWIGFRPDGSAATRGAMGVVLNTGAHDNIVGGRTRAGRNIIGNVSHAIELYGPGTDNNVIQNNQLCTGPTGFTTAFCLIGVDHNFGPKGNLIGGTDPDARNVVGRTTHQAVELSHGWDPAGGGSTPTYQINDNRVIGNWLGFRGDGSYDPAYRSGQNHPGNSDNGQGVNVYDGSNDNVVEGNHIAAVYDGITFSSGNALRNVARNNVIGVSPLGQAAPLTWWGVRLRQGTKLDVIEGNVIRNAGLGGVGLVNSSVFQIRITRNIVTDTNGWAIDLFGQPGPDPNDPNDSDSGANTLLNTPVITAANTATVRGTGLAGAVVEVYRATRPAGGFGLPEAFLGSATVAANGSWNVAANVDVGDRVTALQIRNNRDTSELSANREVVAAPTNDAPTARFTEDCDGLTCAFTDRSVDGDGSIVSHSWTFGDGGTASAGDPSHTFPSRGTYRVRLTVTDDDGATATTAHRITVVPSGPYARDTFTRRVSGGWGRANVGGRWSVRGQTSHFGVDGSRGWMRLPRARAMRSAGLSSVYARDVDLKVQLTGSKGASGGEIQAYLDARYESESTHYRARMRIATSGRVFVQAIRVVNGTQTPIGDEVRVRGLTYTAGARIWLQARFTGASPTTIRIRAWRGSTPSGWTYVATDDAVALQDAGRIGVRTRLARGASQAPVAIRWDRFRAGPA